MPEYTELSYHIYYPSICQSYERYQYNLRNASLTIGYGFETYNKSLQQKDRMKNNSWCLEIYKLSELNLLPPPTTPGLIPEDVGGIWKLF